MAISIKDIEDCLQILATLCEAYGGEYWATYEVFEKEHVTRLSLRERIRTHSRYNKFKNSRKAPPVRAREFKVGNIEPSEYHEFIHIDS